MRSTTHLIFKGTLVLSFLVISLFCSSLPGFPRLTAQARSQVQTNWPEFGFDPQNSRYNPNETILTPSTVSGLTLAWIHQKQKSISTSPAVVIGKKCLGRRRLLRQHYPTHRTLEWEEMEHHLQPRDWDSEWGSGRLGQMMCGLSAAISYTGMAPVGIQFPIQLLPRFTA
jgi:hypothetical protein